MFGFAIWFLFGLLAEEECVGLKGMCRTPVSLVGKNCAGIWKKYADLCQVCIEICVQKITQVQYKYILAHIPDE